jgi:hypothetical protein
MKSFMICTRPQASLGRKKTRRIRCVGQVVHLGVKKVYKVSVQQREGKIPQERQRCRRKSRISMDPKDIVWRVLSGFIWLRIRPGG